MGSVRSTDAIRKRRGQLRHNAENVGAQGIILFIFSLFGDSLTGTQAAWLVAGSGFVFGAVAKFSSENQLGARLLKTKWLSKIFPALLATVWLSIGCAGFIGVSTPMEVTGGDGDPIMAHEVKGVAWAFWDGAVGSNIEGGTGGEDSLDSVGGWIDSALRAVGGILTGAGAAITPPPVAEPVVRAPQEPSPFFD